MKCPTTSGRFHCTVGDAGHAGQCECEDVPVSMPMGPYRDRTHSLAYLRGRLDAAKGGELDAIGRVLGFGRADRDDAVYRERLWKAAGGA